MAIKRTFDDFCLENVRDIKTVSDFWYFVAIGVVSMAFATWFIDAVIDPSFRAVFFTVPLFFGVNGIILNGLRVRENRSRKAKEQSSR